MNVCAMIINKPPQMDTTGFSSVLVCFRTTSTVRHNTKSLPYSNISFTRRNNLFLSSRFAKSPGDYRASRGGFRAERRMLRTKQSCYIHYRPRPMTVVYFAALYFRSSEGRSICPFSFWTLFLNFPSCKLIKFIITFTKKGIVISYRQAVGQKIVSLLLSFNHFG